MLVLDSAAVQRLKEDAAIQKHAEETQRWCEMEAANSSYLLDAETDPTAVPRRLGRMMTAGEFERRVLKICPTMRFISGAMTPLTRFKKMVLPGPNGEELWSSVYHGDLMPERSIMTRKTEDIPDLTQKVLHRADLPHYEFVPNRGYVWDPRDLKPGYKRVEIPWRPVKKGWRTLLLQMIADKVARIPDVERHFYGADSSPEWSGGTGRRAVTRPW